MPSENWGLQKNWGKKEGELSVHDLRKELEEMKMDELRKYVKKNKLKASDTSKPELVDEIIEEMEDKK